MLLFSECEYSMSMQTCIRVNSMAKYLCFQSGPRGEGIITISPAQEHTPAFIRKGKSSPGTGTHQSPGARRGCLLQGKMLLITSSLGSLLAVPRGAQEAPNSYLPVSVRDNNSLWASAHVPLLLKMHCSWRSLILFVCGVFKSIKPEPLCLVCVEQSGGLQELKLQVFLGPDLIWSPAVLSSADWGLVVKGWVPSVSRLRMYRACVWGSLDVSAALHCTSWARVKKPSCWLVPCESVN